MTKEQAEFLVKVAEETGNQDIDLRTDYSARFDYDTTYGVVVENWGTLFADCINYLKNQDTEDIDKVPDFTGFKTDNMGRDIILY